MLTVLYSLTVKEEKLRKFYEQLDIDKDGRVDMKDLVAAVKSSMRSSDDQTHAYYAKVFYFLYIHKTFFLEIKLIKQTTKKLFFSKSWKKLTQRRTNT